MFVAQLTFTSVNSTCSKGILRQKLKSQLGIRISAKNITKHLHYRTHHINIA